MATSRENLMAILVEKYPQLNLRTTEEFNGNKGGIWVGGTESGITASDEQLLFDYYAEDWLETTYQFGVHNEIREVLEANGWFAEWHDCGTIMFWLI